MTIRDGQSVAETVRELRARPEVATAAPNPIARASALRPARPRHSRGVAGGWQQLQWNFLAGRRRQRAGRLAAPDRRRPPRRPGRRRRGARHRRRLLQPRALPALGRVASRRTVRCRRSPDFHGGDFVRGYDFVDRRPPAQRRERPRHARRGHDRRGRRQRRRRHRARLRRADHAGAGARPARRGRQRDDLGRHPLRRPPRRRGDQPLVRVRHPGHAQPDPGHHRRPALRAPQGRARGRRRRATPPRAAVAYPARATDVLSVGATTQHLCVAEYSNTGANLDLTAPGGGADAVMPGRSQLPARASPPGGNIFQMTFEGSPRRFGLPARRTWAPRWPPRTCPPPPRS